VNIHFSLKKKKYVTINFLFAQSFYSAVFFVFIIFRCHSILRKEVLFGYFLWICSDGFQKVRVDSSWFGWYQFWFAYINQEIGRSCSTLPGRIVASVICKSLKNILRLGIIILFLT